MPDVRPLNTAKYGISKYAFRTAYAYCLQYNEWKEELEKDGYLISSPHFSVAGGCGCGISDRTADLAVRRSEIEKKIMRIEETASEAVGVHGVLYPYLLAYVTTEGATFAWLKKKGIPCERTLFYEIRRRFYWMISKKI